MEIHVVTQHTARRHGRQAGAILHSAYTVGNVSAPCALVSHSKCSIVCPDDSIIRVITHACSGARSLPKRYISHTGDRNRLLHFTTPAPGRKYWIFVSVCMSVRKHIAKTMRPNFTFSTRIAGSHLLTAVQYVMCFRFCGRRHVCT